MWCTSVVYGGVYLIVALVASHFLGGAVQAPVTLSMPTATRAQHAAKVRESKPLNGADLASNLVILALICCLCF